VKSLAAASQNRTRTIEPYECYFVAVSIICHAIRLFRPLTTTAMVVLEHMNYYGAGDGPTDHRAPQFYITIVHVHFAFTGLLKFYHAVDKDL
jgi:hypothetical protein